MFYELRVLGFNHEIVNERRNKTTLFTLLILSFIYAAFWMDSVVQDIRTSSIYIGCTIGNYGSKTTQAIYQLSSRTCYFVLMREIPKV
jgi:hypothetical protein